MARVEINKAKALAYSSDLAFRYVYKASLKTTGLAKMLVPVKTGETRGSIQYKVERRSRYRTVGRVGSPLNKAHYVHEGTRPHVIRARRKKALRFVSEGRVYIRRQVYHPGIGSTPFLTVAMRTVCVPMGFKIERRLPARLDPRAGTLAP